MARSRRRAKKSRPIVRVGVRKTARSTKKEVLPKLPQALSSKEGALLGAHTHASVTWDVKTQLSQNYSASGVVRSPNEGFGRNMSLQRRDSGDGNGSDADDATNSDINADDGANGSKPKSAPYARPTPRMRQIVEQLRKAHGDDLDAMVRDRKLNAMQHSRGKLERMIKACNFWDPNSKHDFRAENKRYDRL